MQIMKPPLILSFSTLFLAGCAGTVAQQPSKISGSAVSSSQKNVAITSEPAKTSPVRAAAKTHASARTPLEKSVFAPRNKGLTAEVLHYLMVAEIAGQRGKLGIAAANYLQAARVSQDVAIAERASRIAIFARKDTAALQAGAIWVKLAPDNADAHQLVAAMLVRTGDIEGALEHFQKVLALSKKGEQKTFMLIMALLGKERDKHIALDIMKRLLEKHRHSASAYYAYANLALLTKEYDAANQAIDKALSMKKAWYEAIILKSTVLARLDKNDQAVSFLREQLKRQPDNHKLHLYYARKLVDSKKYEQAYDEFRKVYLANKNNDALYAMGLLANSLNKISLAEEYFKKLIDAGVRKNEAHFYLGQIREKKKDLSAAIDWYSRVHSGVYAFESRLRIIALLGQQGKVAQAREQVRAIDVSRPSEQVRLYIVEGEVLRENKLYDEAIELYTEGLGAIPDNIDLLYARALVNEKLNNIDEAIQDLRTVVKLDPQSVQALNALGYTLVDKTDKIHEGMEYIKQAYQLKPTDPAIIDSMGWAYYRLGNLDQAIIFLQRAFKAFNDAEVAAHLGEVLWVRGEREKARKIWKNSLRDAPEHDTLLNVIKRFMP